MTKRLLLLALLATILGVFVSAPKANALSSSDFKPGRIIDDSVFFNGTSISPNDIQTFLNAKVPVCDTNHPSSNPAYQPPFTCLKDFRQDTPAKAAEAGLCNAYAGGNKSAAEIIYEVGLSCGVSQRALIVLLEKEQSLVTDDWPWSIQYRSATGFGCPDTAACDTEYYGFFNQVYSAARQFKRYARDESLFRYRAYRENSIGFNPNPDCGSSNVFIENQATAGLYNYTPYQPNAGVLANKFSGGRFYASTYPDCGAYGNVNFFKIYNDWFGPTTNSEDYWILVKHPTDGRYFVATNFAVHYVPNQQALNDWGLATVQPVTVTAGFITSRTYGSPLNRLLRDKYNNFFLMDGGKKHYVRDTKYLSLWQQDINSAVTIHGLSYYVTDGDWLGYCAKSLTAPQNIWLMNGGKFQTINDNSLQSAWGCNGSQITSLTSNFISTYLVNGAATRSTNAPNNSKLIADQGALLTSIDQQAVGFYIPSSETPFALSSQLQSLLPTKVLTLFAQDISTGGWFLVENGNKHYISSPKIAELWGLNGLTPVSSSLLAGLTSGLDLTAAAKTISPNKYYVLDNTKRHYLPDAASVSEWLPNGATILTMPSNLIDRYADGASFSSPVGKSDSGDYFIAQNGTRIALTSLNAVDAWTNSILQPIAITNKLYNYLTSAGSVPYTLKQGSNFYYLEGGIRYAIPSNLDQSWSLSQAIAILPETLARYSLSPTSMTPYVQYAGKTYALSGLIKTELSSSLQAVVPPAQVMTLQKNYFGTNSYKTSHILRSSVGADARLWLTSNTGKILLPSTAYALNLGYISRSVALTLLTPEALNAIPTDPATASLLIQSPTGSLKLVSFAEGLGFADGASVNAYAAVTNSVDPVSQEIFNQFSVNRTATRLIRDDSGKVYWLEGGKKRWILNGSLLGTTYAGIAQTYLQSTVTTLIPDGTSIQ